MKKIFTLICVVLVTMSASAQREIWDPNTEEIQALITTALDNPTKLADDNFLKVDPSTFVFPSGTRDEYQTSGDWSSIIAKASKIEMTSWILETGTTSVKLKVVSTPDTGDAAENKSNGLQMGSGNNGGQPLSGVDGFPTFTNSLKAKNGGGGIGYLEFFEVTDNNPETRRVIETPWTPGCGKAPTKGFYCMFTPSKDGYITAGVYINKNLNSKTLYVIDGSDFKTVPNLKIQGFRNNNTYEFHGEVGEGEPKPATCIEWKLDDTYKLIIEDGNTDQRFYAYVTWPVKSGVDYYLTGGSHTIGISGFFFDETDPASITSVSAEKFDGPIYNLAGQRVSESYKGVVIQNGKKVVKK